MAFQKILGALVAGFLAILALGRGAAQWVGLSTLGEDWEQLVNNKLPGALDWLFSTPPWAPAILALVLVMWITGALGFIWRKLRTAPDTVGPSVEVPDKSTTPRPFLVNSGIYTEHQIGNNTLNAYYTTKDTSLRGKIRDVIQSVHQTLLDEIDSDKSKIEFRVARTQFEKLKTLCNAQEGKEFIESLNIIQIYEKSQIMDHLPGPTHAADWQARVEMTITENLKNR